VLCLRAGAAGGWGVRRRSLKGLLTALARFGDPELICLNVNTPADLERAAAVIAG
jgi:hypothetical protein